MFLAKLKVTLYNTAANERDLNMRSRQEYYNFENTTVLYFTCLPVLFFVHCMQSTSIMNRNFRLKYF